MCGIERDTHQQQTLSDLWWLSPSWPKAPDCGSGYREFESHQPPHIEDIVL